MTAAGAHPTPGAEGLSLAALVQGMGRRRPDARALVEGSRGRTYAELIIRSLRLAGHIQAIVSPECRVAIYGENRIEWVEAYLAAHLAHIPVVPINGRYRSREVAHILGDAEIGLVLHDDRVLDVAGVPELLEDVPSLSLDGSEYVDLLERAPARPIVADRWADEDVVVYTSGTTALPKGVRYTPVNQLVSGALLPMILSGYGAGDRFLIFTPLAHRGAATFLVCGLICGAEVHLIADYSADGLARYAREHDITVFVGVPTALRDLINLRRDGTLDPIEGVRHVFLTGEAMPGRFREEAMALFPSARFGSAYASTECGYVTYLDHEDQLAHPESCGRPVPGVQVRVVDERGVSMAPGETGELLVRAGRPGSFTVAAGYVGDERFTDAEGWFATGDVGYIDETGFVHVVDRKKHMILSGGMNVASAEVEAIIATHPAVSEVAVTGEPDERLGERVVAWVVASSGAELTEDDVREHVARVAAPYKKPRAVRFVDALPRTVSGKVMKRELGVA